MYFECIQNSPHVYFEFVMVAALYFCKHPLQTEKLNYTKGGWSQMSLFTYLSLWNSSNASSHAAPGQITNHNLVT